MYGGDLGVPGVGGGGGGELSGTMFLGSVNGKRFSVVSVTYGRKNCEFPLLLLLLLVFSAVRLLMSKLLLLLSPLVKGTNFL